MNQAQQLDAFDKYQKKHDIPDSYIRATQHIGDTNHPEGYYSKALHDITGRQVSFVSQREAKLTMMYFFATVLREKHKGLFSINEILNTSKIKAEELIAKNPWMDTSQDEDGNVVVNAHEEIRRIYKNNRHQHTKSEIVEMINEAVEVKSTTLSSYLSSCKKDFGPCKGWKEDQRVKANGSTKLQDVLAAFATTTPTTKPEAMELIHKTVETSAAGANTLYYAVVKELNLNISSPRSQKKSKQSMATDIVKAHIESLDKNDIIDKIIEITGTTKAGANTYYRKAIKEIK